MQEDEVRRGTFVLRIWEDRNGRVWGKVNEPASGWQRPFAGVDQLGLLLLEQLKLSAGETAVAAIDPAGDELATAT